MARISDHSTFFREGLERMPGNEPSSLDFVFLEQFQESAYSNATGEEAWLPVSRAFQLAFASYHRPREMSLVESSPPYEPSQPATASMSTEMQQRAPEGCQRGFGTQEKQETYAFCPLLRYEAMHSFQRGGRGVGALHCGRGGVVIN